MLGIGHIRTCAGYRSYPHLCWVSVISAPVLGIGHIRTCAGYRSYPHLLTASQQASQPAPADFRYSRYQLLYFSNGKYFVKTMYVLYMDLPLEGRPSCCWRYTHCTYYCIIINYFQPSACTICALFSTLSPLYIYEHVYISLYIYLYIYTYIYAYVHCPLPTVCT